MRMYIYNVLVNRHSGIKSRYHKLHDGASGIRRLLSYGYLLWLNLCYYLFFCHFLGEDAPAAIYEEKRLRTDAAESVLENQASAEEMAEELLNYDIISFDLFDTLVFRPFSEPSDLFYLSGERLKIMDFKRIRKEQEYLARLECFKKRGHSEVSFKDIWSRIEREVGISAEEGMEAECDLEIMLCYANPFMLQVYQRLQKAGKNIIITSDTYLPEEFLHRLLGNCGYTGYKKLYVSNAYGKSKAEGTLYQMILEEIKGTGSKEKPIKTVHVGDNEISDIRMAKKYGIKPVYYPNVNKMAVSYRPYDMSPIIGGAYRGVVDNYLYCGLKAYSMEYEYGFIYGGLFVLGYCNFIHDYCKIHGIDKLLFLSRDGDILKQVYEKLYPEEDSVYVYWSRAAGTKLMAEYNRYDYFQRFLYHKVNQGLTIQEVLEAMELHKLGNSYPRLDAKLTDKNAEELKTFLQAHLKEITESYSGQMEAAKAYYTQILSGASKAAVVDIGWAGSGAISLSYLAEQIWKLPCEITGIIAGTNTLHNAEPDASEGFLQTKKIVSYLYSMSHNRDLMKKHDPGKNYNLYWELLLASPKRQLKGFEMTKNLPTQNRKDYEIWNENRKIAFRFGKGDTNQEGIKEIQRGILDFAEEYRSRFFKIPYMFHISGRDAYAPMLAAASCGERYLKEIYQRFDLHANID